MSRWGRDVADIRLDIADAIAQDADVLEYLRAQHRARWGLGED